MCSLATALAVQPGCLSQHPADPTRALRATGTVPLPPGAWPTRNVQSAVDELGTIGPTVRLCRGQVVRVGEQLISTDSMDVTDVLNKAPSGVGYILELGAKPGTNPPRLPEQPAFDGHLVFISHALAPAAAPAPCSTPDNPPTIGQRGVHFDLSMPLTPAGTASNSQPAGLVVQFHGLGGVEYEQGTIDALRRRGMMIIAAEFPWNRWRATVDEISTQADLLRVADELATTADDCLAEAAYASEAAVEYLQQTRPELRGLPVVVVGFSAGSLAAPTAAARLIARPENRLSAMVLVGTGCNIIRILQESELTNGGIMVLRFGERINGAMAGLLAGSYIERSKLDSYHSSTALRRLPVLMVQGSSDTIVPSSSGTELNDRLGNPDLWRVSGGHRTLFLQLDTYANSIAEWVSKAAALPERPGIRSSLIGN